MSDLGEKMRRAAESLGGFTRDEARMMIVIMDEVVPIAEAELQKRDQEAQAWETRAINAQAEIHDTQNALNEANKLLDQTIEVLEGMRWQRPTLTQWEIWVDTQAKPLLDNLKAKKP